MCVLAVGLVLAGCSSGTWSGVGGVGPDVDRLRVTGSEPVESPFAARLSPDGKRLLLMVARPCVTELDGSGEQCVDRDKVGADLTNATWSPDATKLAFTDDFWRAFREPDVWVFDVATGDLRNLTDDGVDEYDLSGPNEGALIDVLPSWSPDGETIRFARGRADGESMELMAMPAGGGEASVLREVRCAPTALIGLVWSGSRVAWTCGIDAPEVFLGDHTGDDADRALPGKTGEDRMLLSFSPDGQWLLVDSATPYGLLSSPEGGQARVVPAEGGDPVPVADGAVGYPTWSPGGHALAYVDLPNKLNVVAEPGGEPRELRRAEIGFGAPDDRRLGWVEGKLLVHADREPVLLTLDE
jgi:Tol biopolymer transport system component